MNTQASPVAPTPSIVPSTTAPRAAGPRWATLGYALAGGVFALALLVQVFLAGGALFVAPSWWPAHAQFGMMVSLGPIIMLALAFVARLRARTTWLTALLLGLTVLQSMLPTVPAKLGLPILAALHPVNAVILFALAALLAWGVWQQTPLARHER